MIIISADIAICEEAVELTMMSVRCTDSVSHNNNNTKKKKNLDVCWEETFLWCSIWNPQYFTLLLLHDGHDLSANVGDAAGLDDACNRVRVWEEYLQEECSIFMSDLAATRISELQNANYYFECEKH